MSPKRSKPQKPDKRSPLSASDAYAGLSARALSLHRAGRLNEAETVYLQLLEVRPHDVPAVQLLSALLLQQRRMPEAISLMKATLEKTPSDLHLLNNLGAALLTSGKFSEALETLDRALLVDAQDPTARKNRMIAAERLQPSLVQRWQARQTICDWTDHDPDFRRIVDSLGSPEQVVRPSHGLMVNDPQAQLDIARRWAAAHFSGRQRQRPRSVHTNRRIKLGYFSADFYNHATMVLLAGVLERHDRRRFEIFGFSTGHHTNDAMRQRAQASMDKFTDVSGMKDEQIAELSRSLEIDIALDLSGHTQDARTGLFAYGAAPVQINFLGYPGTMGTTFHDYIVADRTIIPETHRQYFSEKVIALPGSYQPTDEARQISTTPVSRKEAGLPEQAFVFCCFNNAFKITPEVFHSWTNILRSVPGSVLWLLETSEACTANLRKEAGAAGIDPLRLVFARRVPMPDHLARHQLADLFLDTMPYNAHTTASDALFTGLPVLTRMGSSFSSRVAASLNMTMGLPELITTNTSDYEAMAVALARDTSRLQDIRARTRRGRETSALFDTGAYTRAFEEAMTAALERHRNGLAPDHIFV
jgi:protein O-GlcNAc transferase